ncbi:hypothetical protein FHT77_001764 [Rhizobium sp. BK181]|uniref:DUF6634 family protein n=1 Tax=Rhizobium sp. BK181 TaxID=2587072 RepID=UPI001616062F|nr:DUF6634 family protein [Rhizobium sp. BK181]MBB3315899.1 hypothetical protein [Rhizobium sp. BK181]
MTYQWLDEATVLRLLKDLQLAEAGEFEKLPIANAPLLRDSRTVLGNVFALSGTVTGHPRLRDGKEIVTSQLFYLNKDLGIARTMNRWYRVTDGALLKGH